MLATHRYPFEYTYPYIVFDENYRSLSWAERKIRMHNHLKL